MLGIRQSSIVERDHRRDQGGHRGARDRLRRVLRHPDNWAPFIPENTGVSGQFGWSGIMRAPPAIIFFAYIGFDAVSTAAQEAKNPQRDVPIGILGSLIICTILYVADVRRAHRHARRTRSSTTRRRSPSRWSASRADVAVDPGDRRRARRPDLGDPGHDAGAVAHLLFDVARRTAAARRSVPAIPSGRPRCSRPC